MGNDRGINQDEKTKEIYERLINNMNKKLTEEMNVNRKDLFNVWVTYNKNVKKLGRKKALGELIMDIKPHELDVLKYFLALGLETINIEFLKEDNNEKGKG